MENDRFDWLGLERALDGIARALIGSTIGIANNKSKGRVRFSGSGSITGGGFTNIAYNTVDFDTETAWNTSTGKFTCKTAGYYHFQGQTAIGTSTPTIMIPALFKNGVECRRGFDFRVASANKTASAQDDIYMAVGDTMEMRTYVDITSNVDGGNPYLNVFSWFMISQQ